MRPTMLALSAAIFALTAVPALAAPTCLDRAGETVRCGTPGAMPVGWTPSPGDVAARAPSPPELTPAEAAALIYILIAFFGLIALMPQFDGWREGDWDEQEGDRPRRR